MVISVREEILEILPPEMQNILYEILQDRDLEEIRFRVGCPLCIWSGGQEFYIKNNGKRQLTQEGIIVTKEMLEEILNRCCHFSLYAYEEQICQGYLSLPGGHRLGITGMVSMEEGKILSMKHIGSMNLRIAKQHLGIAQELMPYLYENREFMACLIFAGPGCGKTSLLRDCIRMISSGFRDIPGCNVAVVDERSELGGCYEGWITYDLGIRTDLLDGCKKYIGVPMLLRSMNPRVIAMDEISGKEDIDTLNEISRCGVTIIATIHSGNINDLARKMGFESMQKTCGFRRFVGIQNEKGIRHYEIYDDKYSLLGEYVC